MSTVNNTTNQSPVNLNPEELRALETIARHAELGSPCTMSRDDSSAVENRLFALGLISVEIPDGHIATGFGQPFYIATDAGRAALHPITLVAEQKQPVLTKTAINLLRHLWERGGEITFNHRDDSYNHNWGTLLKNDNVKWHNQKITLSTFKKIRPYLTCDEIDDFAGWTIYVLNITAAGSLFERQLEQKLQAVS